nr:integrase, catalytic region, zinc finger, CCHC-type, peptidase aspartic, catalytic [Tanacetum cinerariifolium]
MHEVNEIKAEKIACVANPLALVAQQQPVYHPQNHPTHYTQNSSTRSQQTATQNRGKAIDISPRINKNAGYENQRNGNVAGARETVGSSVVQKSGIQCYNCKEFRHVAMECQKPKRPKDAAYHREKMLLYWELEAHYMYMAQLQEVFPDVADSGPVFDDEPLQKVLNDDHYNVFAMESVHPEQSKSVHDTYLIEQDAQHVIIDSLDMSNDREEIDQNDDDNDLAKERELLASLIDKLKCEIDENKSRNKFLETSNKDLIEKLKGEIEDFKNKSLESSNNFFKEANNKLSETNNLLYTDYKKSQAKLARRDSKEYASKMELKCAKRTQFVNEIDQLSREYYYADHMNAILGVYTKLDEVTNLQCDYLELLEKCEGLETELSKRKRMSKTSESVQKHAINLELELQQCKEKIKNDMLFKVNKTKDFCKEREYYFEIQDLKAQLQDKGIVISELKKLIKKMKAKSVYTKFEKSSVIRQPNAFKSQRTSVLGKPTTFSKSFIRKDFTKSTLVTQTHVSKNFSKPVTAQTLPTNKKSILKNMNVLVPGMSKLHTDHNQTRTSQLPQDSRKANKRVSFSTGVIPTTSVSRPPLKSNPQGDRVMHNNSQGKKQAVEDHRRSLVEIVLFIVDSGCSKHMTGNLKLLINFVEKFLGTVKFRNDQITPILRYRDLVQGAVMIKRVYYVKGLNHNLFSVGQFCDADLEVAFRKSTCYIRDLKG